MEGGLDGADLYGELTRSVAGEVGCCALVMSERRIRNMAHCIPAFRVLRCGVRRRGRPDSG